jgi:t-SNARE complex subunit (syntaxin)
VGFNATRRYRDKKTTDLVILISAIVIVAVLVGWVLAAGGR